MRSIMYRIDLDHCTRYELVFKWICYTICKTYGPALHFLIAVLFVLI